MPRLASASGVNFYMYTGTDGDGPNEYTNATMVFLQAAAPTGWTKNTTYDDYALRITSGNVSAGGNITFSNTFTSRPVTGTITSTTFSVGNTTLTVDQIPAHSHTVIDYLASPTIMNSSSPTTLVSRFSQPITDMQPGTSNVSAQHSHTQPTANCSTFAGSALNMSVKYVDSLLATYTS